MMDRNLDGFPSYYHKNRAQHPRLLKVIEAVYQQALPFKLDGPDLATFLTILYQAVCYFKPKLVVQTGTFIGTSSIALALGFRQNGFGQLHTIDPEPPEYFGQSNPVSIARKVTTLGGLQNSIAFLRGYSTVPLDSHRQKLVDAPFWQLLEVTQQGLYHLLVVDGDHTFLGCYLDLVYGAKGLAQLGSRLIIVHDYLGIPSVRLAVDKWKDRHPNIAMKVVRSPCGIALLQLP